MPAMHPLSHSASRAIACHFEVGAAERAAELLESESGASRIEVKFGIQTAFRPKSSFSLQIVYVKSLGAHQPMRRSAAFDLHQSTERFYHCVLPTLTLFSPKSHRIRVLRSQAESRCAAGRGLAARHSLCRRCFEPLSRAYVEARYSSKYTVSNDELQWLVARVKDLQTLAETILQVRLGA
ncbi:hypothetical protein AJ87_39480 [Rhizobium yanglingense]|nr:hypothetical protein AJ87_39480 [Rhizobium yanglingense]